MRPFCQPDENTCPTCIYVASLLFTEHHIDATLAFLLYPLSNTFEFGLSTTTNLIFFFCEAKLRSTFYPSRGNVDSQWS